MVDVFEFYMSSSAPELSGDLSVRLGDYGVYVISAHCYLTEKDFVVFAEHIAARLAVIKKGGRHD